MSPDSVCAISASPSGDKTTYRYVCTLGCGVISTLQSRAVSFLDNHLVLSESLPADD